MTDDLTGSRQAAADRFIDAVRRYVAEGPADLQGPADRLVDALDGHATDADIAAGLNCAAAAVSKYWQHLGGPYGGHSAVQAMTQSHVDLLDGALFVAVNGFDRQQELVAAEQAVQGLEAEAVRAREDLENAVTAGDLEKVLALRGVSEVTLPGRLGEARERLLTLRLEAAQAQLDAAISVRRRKADQVVKAEKARDEAAALLQQRVQELAADQAVEHRAAGNEDAARARIAASSAALEDHHRTHRQAQQSRIRQLAGLAPLSPDKETPVPTDVLTAARDRLAEIGFADHLLSALVAGDDPSRDARLTDENAATAWQAVAVRLRGYEGGRHARRTDVGLADLHGRLMRLMDDVRAAADADVPALLRRYVAIRHAQKALTMVARDATDEVEFSDLNLRIPVTLLLKSAGMISNVDEVWPSWRDFTRRNGYDEPPWAYPDGRPDELAETVANLRWLARGPARPWVPTLRQAAQAFSEQMRAEEARRLETAKKTSPYT